jgi:import inner membrane translocase subunit TIM23
MSSNQPFKLPDVGGIDPNRLGLYGNYNNNNKQNKGPDYINNSNNRKGRDPFSRISFTTGVIYLSTFTGGACYGLVEGWKSAVNPSLKVRLNSTLNAVSRRGSNLGNAGGVVAFIHTAVTCICEEFKVDYYLGHPISIPMIAGAITGGSYKSSVGLRGAAVASIVGSGISCTYWYLTTTEMYWSLINSTSRKSPRY